MTYGKGKPADGSALGPGRIVLIWSRDNRNQPAAVGVVLKRGAPGEVNVVGWQCNTEAGDTPEIHQGLLFSRLRNVTEEVRHLGKSVNQVYGWSWPSQEIH